MSGQYLIYGANGYTGDLIAREAVQRGQRPVLAGRNASAVRGLAEELGLEHRAFGLEVGSDVESGLEGVAAVIHCAGPFAHTFRPMAEACLRRKVHYLDVTGEVEIFESLAARDAEARSAGVMLLPGVGFDVVPSDCLAAHLKRRLPTATHLALAFVTTGGMSRGTATTMAENIHRGGLVRQGGVLTRVPPAWKTRRVDFGRGPTPAITIPWGDVSTAFHSTGIPNIEVYTVLPWTMRAAVRLSRPFLSLLAAQPVQSFLKSRIRARGAGPTPEERSRGVSLLWGEVRDDKGACVASRLRGPEGYTLTMHTALACVERAASGEAPPGFQTPSKAYGPDLVLTVPGIEREDL